MIDTKYVIDIIPLKNINLYAFYNHGAVGFFFFVPGDWTDKSPLIDYDQLDEYIEKVFHLDPTSLDFSETYDSEKHQTEFVMSGQISFLWGLLVRFALWILKRRLKKGS